MLLSVSALALLAFVPAVLSQGRAPFGYYQVNGQTKLVGSSFGIPGFPASYDYIIVGGGTAGLTVADRLAKGGASVAVIEGGGFYETDNGNFSQIPAFDSQFSNAFPSSIQPLVDWGIVTPPQPQLQGRQIHYTQGKCMGGSSARNYLAYHRGTVGSYHNWATAVGDTSYEFSNFLQYFEKSCAFTPPNHGKLPKGTPKYMYDESVFSSSGGPLQISYSNWYHPFSDPISKALNAIGLSQIAGLNSGKLIGFASATTTLDPAGQVRSSSETSFGQDAIVNTNTIFYKSTTAQKILFGSDNKATGVQVVTAGLAYQISANKEVIVSAGAFRSPQLLMVSGIGPQSTLGSLGIPVVSNLKGVGQNMWDQNYFGTGYKVSVTTDSQLIVNPAYAAQATSDYLKSQQGPLTNSGANWIGWEKVPSSLSSNFTASTKAMLAGFPSDWPDWEILPLPVQTFYTTDADNYMSITLAVLSTNSRGNVTISSSDTSVNPVVQLPWLVSPEDQQVAVAAFRRAREIASQTGIVVGAEVYPGTAVQTDAQILSFIQQSIGPIHHAASTCKMGQSSDPMAVVDSHARVFGVAGLRVVDVSAFPLLPPGHPQSTVYALAEKIAADILAGQ